MWHAQVVCPHASAAYLRFHFLMSASYAVVMLLCCLIYAKPTIRFEKTREKEAPCEEKAARISFLPLLVLPTVFAASPYAMALVLPGTLR